MSFNCFAAPAAKEKLKPFQYDPQPLEPTEVEVTITHCGICHSDIHLIDNDWGVSNYPLIPGHEIVGNVAAVGAAIKILNPGQRVGIGWQCGSDHVCEWCVKGEDNLCAKQIATCVGRPGGFAQAIRVDARFAFPLPETLDSAAAAPLFCGGATVYSPLREHIDAPNKRVGIIGIGGLGHLGLQFANALGAEVTAFSHSQNKAGEAKALGAHNFVSSENKNDLSKLKNSFDLILSTVNVPLDWKQYVELLRPRGTLCFVGAVPSEINLPIVALIGGRRNIGGSNIAGPAQILEMLTFAARNNIGAKTEIFAMPDVNNALDKVRAGNVRYRAVLTN